MFKKLLKHDIKDTFLEIVVINGAMILFSAITLLSDKLNFGFLNSFSTMGYVLSIFVSIGLIIGAVIKCFHTQMFSNCGYLTLTIPAPIDKILISKILVNLLWVFTTFSSFIISLMIISMGFGGTIFGFLFNITESALDIVKNMALLLSYSLMLITILILILVITNTGRLKKHKLLKGIVIYIMINAISSTLGAVFLVRGSVADSGQISETAQFFVDFSSNLVLAVLLYFITRYTITHKLELE